MILFSCQ